MKRVFSLVMIFALLCTIGSMAAGEGFLPSLEEEFGIDMPFVNVIIGKDPIKSDQQENGQHIEEYKDVTHELYLKIGQCFGEDGFVLKEKGFIDDVIQLTIQKDNIDVSFEYNITNNELKTIYPRYYTEDKMCYNIGKQDTSIFPEIEEMAGVILPRLSSVLKREPDSLIESERNILIEEYNDFFESDYEAVSKYLFNEGCEVINYSKEKDVLTINLEKNGSGFTFKYDPQKSKAIAEYNSDSYIEPVVTSTPVPTATPAPTVNPDDYNTYAAIFVTAIWSTLKNPDSMQINYIHVMEYKGDSYIVIDVSAMNGFGGFNRDTYSFKFESGHVSLNGKLTDYDQYEKHKKEFKLIATLNIDDVLKLINK